MSLQNTTHFELASAHVFTAQKALKDNGSKETRSLLEQALKQLNINDSLSESQLPYRLLNSSRQVSFSHSNTSIAIAITKNNNFSIGIDTEDNTVSMAVAKRFFSSKEVTWLRSLSIQNQPVATRLLWMLKEAHIKANQGQLISGLKHDFSPLFNLIETLTSAHTQKKQAQPLLSTPLKQTTLNNLNTFLHPNWAFVAINN